MSKALYSSQNGRHFQMSSKFKLSLNRVYKNEPNPVLVFAEAITLMFKLMKDFVDQLFTYCRYDDLLITYRPCFRF